MTPIQFEIKDAVAYIHLNRPEKFNSFNREMALLLQKQPFHSLTIRVMALLKFQPQ